MSKREDEMARGREVLARRALAERFDPEYQEKPEGLTQSQIEAIHAARERRRELGIRIGPNKQRWEK